MTELKLLKYEKTYPLNTDYNFHFIILGVGGTGSELVAKICRQLSFKRDPFGHQIHDITVVDGDSVEDKNLLRQNFFKLDLGKNKAETMAMKCSTLFNMTVRAFDTYVESPIRLEQIINSSDKIPFIIGCVDTNAVRKMIHQYVKSYRKKTPLFWLDGGNAEFNGQAVLSVKIGGGTQVKLVSEEVEGEGEDRITRRTYDFNLPTVCEHFPDMLESGDLFASEVSCADAAVSDPQAHDTNIESAAILYQFVSNCLRGRLDYHRVTFNVLQGNRLTTFNNESTLRSYGLKLPEEVYTLSDVATSADDQEETSHNDVNSIIVNQIEHDEKVVVPF